MNRLNSSIKRLKKPVIVMYALSIVVFSVSLYLTYKTRPFTSDDVFWQVILMNGWMPFDGSTVSLGNTSIHIDKLPLYILTSFLGFTGRRALFIQSILIGIASFTAFYWSSVYLIKKFLAKTSLSYAALLPFLWLAGLGYSFASLYLNPNWRGFQISFAFILFALTYAFWRRDITLKTATSKFILLLLVIYSGLLVYSDPYMLYFAILPLAVFTIVSYYPLRKISLHVCITTLLAIAATYIFSKIFALIGTSAGVKISVPPDTHIVSFSHFGDNIGSTIHSLLIIFGSNFFGRPLGIGLALPVVNFIILIGITYVTYSTTKKSLGSGKSRPGVTWILFFIATLVMTIAFYMLTTLNQGVTTYRYLLLTVLLSTLIMSYFIATLENKKFVYPIIGILLASTILSIIHLTRATVENKANSVDFSVVNTLDEMGYNKGYANYWDANINSYLSEGHITVIPVICADHRAHPWPWLIKDSILKTNASKSFYIVDPSQLVGPCSKKDVIRQFGKPSETIHLKTKSILLYNHDIQPE